MLPLACLSQDRARCLHPTAGRSPGGQRCCNILHERPCRAKPHQGAVEFGRSHVADSDQPPMDNSLGSLSARELPTGWGGKCITCLSPAWLSPLRGIDAMETDAAASSVSPSTTRAEPTIVSARRGPPSNLDNLRGVVHQRPSWTFGVFFVARSYSRPRPARLRRHDVDAYDCHRRAGNRQHHGP